MLGRVRFGVRRRVAVAGRALGSAASLGLLAVVALVLEAGKRWC